MKTWIFFAGGLLSLAILAFIFRDNPVLASLCLIGLIAHIVLSPIHEKFKDLIRFGAEFSPRGVAVLAETDKGSTLGSGESVQKQVESQMAERQSELGSAVESFLSNSSNSGVSEETIAHVQAIISENMELAQQQALQAVNLLMRRSIFEYVLRGPAPYQTLVDHLTYVFYGRTDFVAKELLHNYIQPMIQSMENQGEIGFTQIGGQWYCYLPKSNPPGGSQGPLSQD